MASVYSFTDLICQAITKGMCDGGFDKHHYSTKYIRISPCLHQPTTFLSSFIKVLKCVQIALNQKGTGESFIEKRETDEAGGSVDKMHCR